MSDDNNVREFYRKLITEGDVPTPELWQSLYTDVFGPGGIRKMQQLRPKEPRRFRVIIGGAADGSATETSSPEHASRFRVSLYNGSDTVHFAAALKQLEVFRCSAKNFEPDRDRAAKRSQKLYALGQAIDLLKRRRSCDADQTVGILIDVCCSTQAETPLSGVVTLPNGTGQEIRVAVFARGDKASAARKAGADYVGAEDLLERIKCGEVQFDRAIATPDTAGLYGRSVSSHPCPWNLIVTTDVAEAVKASKFDVQYQVKRTGTVHAGIGKASFDDKALEENIRAFANAISATPGIGEDCIARVAIVSGSGRGIGIEPSSLGMQ